MATNKKSRLAEIYRSEKKKGGGVASTLGKAAIEKIDPRQLFNQKGFLAAIMPALFKAYKAAPSGGGDAKKLTQLSTPSIVGDFSSLTKQVSALTAQMHEVAVNSTIIAKNTMVLPAMARDTNITRQNIAKLVKLQGDAASRKADMFFKTSAEREMAYESKFKKEGGIKGPTVAGATTTPAQTEQNTGLTSILKGLADSMSKGVGIAALGVGIGGFFTGLALGGAAVNALGGASGVKDMMVNLAEGLSAFDGETFLRFSALLGAGALFGAVSGVKTKAGAALGMGAIGAGIGLFFSGLSVGGAIGDMIGNSAGIKEMMINFAEGLNAFNPSSMSAFNALLATGGIFGAVAGGVASVGGAKLAGAAAGGATLGMGLIGTGIGLFLAGISVGNKLIELVTGGSSPGSSIKELLINVSDGLKTFESLDSAKLFEITKLLPLLGVNMLAYFGTKGISGIIGEIGDKMSSFFSFIFGKENKSPLEKLSEDLMKFNNVNGENLSKIGQGFKDLTQGIRNFAEAPTPSAPTSTVVTPPPGRALNTETGEFYTPVPGMNVPTPSAATLSSPQKEYDIEKYIAFTNDSGSKSNFEKLDPEIKSAVISAAMDYNSRTGRKLQINSAIRSVQDQQRLWDESVAAGRPGIGPTGKVIGRPGHSLHERGMAVDIQNYNDAEAVGALNRAGLYATVPNDPVHFELAKNRPTIDQPNPLSTGTAIASASSDLANGQRSVSAPNITVVAQQESSSKQKPLYVPPLASTKDNELTKNNLLLKRATSLLT